MTAVAKLCTEQTPRGLRARTAAFQIPSISASVWQFATTVVGYLAIMATMYLAAEFSVVLTLALSVLASGLLVRIFVIQHDCGHGSFFQSRRANDLVGFVCGLLTFTPYQFWKRQHAGHHGVWNNLDRRQSGADIYSSCITVSEYRAMGRWRRRLYRLTRHPLVINILAPPLVFVVLYRVPFDTPKARVREHRSVHATTLIIAAMAVGLGFAFGFDRLALVHLPVMILSSIIGVWLFSVQHCFERTHWRRQADWDYADASMLGSSFLDLPPVLRWFTGNIGFHHIHHLNPRVPNYRLRACHNSHPTLSRAPRFTLMTALRQWRYMLWDEDRGRMVSYRAATAGGS